MRIGFQPSYTLLAGFKDNTGKNQKPITYTADFFRGYDPDFVHLDYNGFVNEEGMRKCVRAFIALIEDGWTWD